MQNNSTEVTEGHSNAEYDALFNAVEDQGALPDANDQADEPADAATAEQPKDDAGSSTEPELGVEVPPWLGADVTNLTADQIKALEPVYKTMLKGMNEKMRQVAELRRQATQQPAEPVATLAEQLAKHLADRTAPKPPVAEAQVDPDVAALLERVDDDTKPLIEQILTVVDKKSRTVAEEIKSQLERKALIDKVTREHNEFIAKRPQLDDKSDEFNQIEYDNFKAFVKQCDQGRSLESMWREYDYDRVAARGTQRVRVAPNRAVEVGSTVGTGKRMSSYELYEREWSKAFGKR